MRRADRQITDDARIDGIIRACTCCRLGLCDEGQAYIVPLSFGFEHTDSGRFFYFHSAREGRKLDLLRRNPAVSFELDTGYQLHTAPTACGCSAGFQSVMGTGTVRFLTDGEERRHALLQLMRQLTGTDAWDFSDAALSQVCVLSLQVTSLTCKVHA